MNERVLNNLLRLVKAKYPFIIDLKYYNMNDYKKFYDQVVDRQVGMNEAEHNFIFTFDLKMLHDMFPDYRIDKYFIKDNRNILTLPTHAFIESDETQSYGREVDNMIQILIQTIIKYDEDRRTIYKVKT